VLSCENADGTEKMREMDNRKENKNRDKSGFLVKWTGKTASGEPF
jgi:hypothetical protein